MITYLITGLTLRQRAVYFQQVVLVGILVQTNRPLPWCQPCSQFGLFTLKVTSGTCISATRDPATKRIQNSLSVRRVVPCIQRFRMISIYGRQVG